MDDQQVRILDDLRDVMTGDILVDDLARSAYSTDASILQVRPLAVLVPRTVADLSAIARYSAETGLCLHARGAGTGLAGESLGPDLVVDTSRYFKAIELAGEDKVRVQAGVTWYQLQAKLAGRQRMFGPDPVSGDRCTIGGMIATDAGGPHTLRYGTTGDHVDSVEIVLASGEVVTLGKEPLAPRLESTPQHLAREVAAIVDEHIDDIRIEQPTWLRKPGGYHLRGVLKNGTVDLARLLTGSEGTLALIAGATLATSPKPAHRGLVLAGFGSLEAAIHAGLNGLECLPSACELIDRRLVSLVREQHPLHHRWIPPGTEGFLIIEQEGRDARNLAHRIELVSTRLRSASGMLGKPVEVLDANEFQLAWGIRGRSIERFARSADHSSPLPFVESVAVPPESLPDLLRSVREILQRHGIAATFMAHVGLGILHVRPLMDRRISLHGERIRDLCNEVFDAVLERKGSCSAEHGWGLVRSGWIGRQFPRLESAYRKIKSVFDPHNQLNPGKLVAAPPGFPLAQLRSSALLTTQAPAIQLDWSHQSLLQQADKCDGCSACRSSDPAVRMCPIFKVHGGELAAPRAKANLMRQIVAGEIDSSRIAADEFRDVADLCVQCKMCRVECPSGVDISKLMLEARAAHVGEQGLSQQDWFFARLEAFIRWGSANASIANRLLGNRMVRWSLEKSFGLSRHRQLPSLHRDHFLRRAQRHGWTRKPRPSDMRPKIAFFADLFVQHHDPRLGEDAVRVLQHQGRVVHVPIQQRASGMLPLRYGDVEFARARLIHNLNAFVELVREGYQIVSTEPSAVVFFRDDARNLLTDRDVELVAQHTFEFSEYLALLAQRGELRQDLAPIPISVGYHEPCHQRAMGPRASVLALMKMIPRLRLVPIDLGCSGMAGTFGLRAESFETSLLAGGPMLRRLSGEDLHMGMTQCSACRMQMEQATSKRTLHPASWFALSYGLASKPEELYRKPAPGLVT